MSNRAIYFKHNSESGEYDILVQNPYIIKTVLEVMTKEQILAQQRADFAVAKFIEEIFGSGHIKEYTFDETRDSALECAKQNIETSSLTEREKHVAKESVDKAVREIAKIFKKGMIQSGRLIETK